MLDDKEQVWLTWVPEAEVLEGEAAKNLMSAGLPQVGSRVEGWTMTEEQQRAFRDLDQTSRSALLSTIRPGDDTLKARIKPDELKQFKVCRDTV